ncbi:MAG: ribosome silencing factor [Anaerolineae bacterium]
MDPLELARYVVDVVEDRKAEDIVLLDLRPDTVLADFFVIANGNSERQLRALMDYVREDVKKNLDQLPYSLAGTPESGWIVLDYGDVVVHLFSENQRDYYNLEALWSASGNVLLSIQ